MEKKKIVYLNTKNRGGGEKPRGDQKEGKRHPREREREREREECKKSLV